MNLPTPYYSRGGITIFHGDCLDVMPTLPGESIDFVLTDPPYLVSYRGRWDRKHKAIIGDTEDSWLRPAFREIWRLMKPNSCCVSFYGWPHADNFLGSWKAIGFRPISHLAFVKRQMGLGRMTRGTHETAYLLSKGQPRKYGVAIADVIDWHREEVTTHPNQKPVASLTTLLNAFCPREGIVLDPFMGSGSTLRAAKDLSLSAVGVDIELGYCQSAAKRMAQEVIPFGPLPDDGTPTP